MFDADRALHRFRPTDVVNFAKESTKQSINNMTQWRKYTIKYNTLAGGLFDERQLTEEAYNCYYWFGIPRNLRQRLEHRILQGRPIHDTSYYTIREIEIAAEWYFRRTRPEAMLLNASEFGFDDYEPEDDSDSDSEDSDSDSDREYQRSRHKKKRSSSRSKREKKVKGSPTTTKKAKFNGNEEEIAGMIRQLNGMKLEDPDYAPAYYKVLALDTTGNAVRCIRAPSVSPPMSNRRTSYSSPAPTNRSTDSTPSSTPLSPPSVPREPSTYPNNIPLNERACYGCGKQGHRVSQCPEVTELVSRNLLQNNAETGRLEWKNGAPLQRHFGETIVHAVERATTGQQGPNVMFTYVDSIPGTRRAVQNFFQAAQHKQQTSRICEIYSDEEESEFDYVETEDDDEHSDSGYKTEEEDRQVYLSVPKNIKFAQDYDQTDDDYDYEDVSVFEADRRTPSTRIARKQIFDGVYPPPRSRAQIPPTHRTPPRNSVPAPPAATGPPPTDSTSVPPAVIPKIQPPQLTPSRSVPTIPRPPTPPLKSSIRKQPELPQLTPVDVRKPRSAPDEDVDIPPIRAHDRVIPPDPPDPDRRPATATEKEHDRSLTQPNTRQSAISNTVNRSAVTNRVFDTKVEVSLRELMEVSKDIRTEFTDLIKVRNPKALLLRNPTNMHPDAPLTSLHAYMVNKKDYWPSTRGILIRLEMTVQQFVEGDSTEEAKALTINAIIDTGSQLNVVRADIGRQRITAPVDPRCMINMNDANGGSGQLRGLIRRAPLWLGNWLSFGDLWMSEQAPFELLLGRPWQRANRVTIDEREEGTYLVMKDPDGHPKLELLAAKADDSKGKPYIDYLSSAMQVFHMHEDDEGGIARSTELDDLDNLQADSASTLEPESTMVSMGNQALANCNQYKRHAKPIHQPFLLLDPKNPSNCPLNNYESMDSAYAYPPLEVIGATADDPGGSRTINDSTQTEVQGAQPPEATSFPILALEIGRLTIAVMRVLQVVIGGVTLFFCWVFTRLFENTEPRDLTGALTRQMLRAQTSTSPTPEQSKCNLRLFAADVFADRDESSTARRTLNASMLYSFLFAAGVLTKTADNQFVLRRTCTPASQPHLGLHLLQCLFLPFFVCPSPTHCTITTASRMPLPFLLSIDPRSPVFIHTISFYYILFLILLVSLPLLYYFFLPRRMMCKHQCQRCYATYPQCCHCISDVHYPHDVHVTTTYDITFSTATQTACLLTGIVALVLALRTLVAHFSGLIELQVYLCICGRASSAFGTQDDPTLAEVFPLISTTFKSNSSAMNNDWSLAADWTTVTLDERVLDLPRTCEAMAITDPTALTLACFFWTHIYCWYGCPRCVIMDNGSEVKAAFDELMKRLRIPHVRISGYNKHATGKVECGHYTSLEALVCSCSGRMDKWPEHLPLALFADRITVSRVTGLSPYQLLHGTDPILPFDLFESTFLATGFKPGISTSELLALRIRQLSKLNADVTRATDTLKQSHFRSKDQFERKFKHRLMKRDYRPHELVLLRNIGIENQISVRRKTDDRYFGPYQVVRKNIGGGYILSELDGAEFSKNPVAAFRLLPYINRHHPFMLHDDDSVSSTDDENTESDSNGSSGFDV
jgi:hypothetical protein